MPNEEVLSDKQTASDSEKEDENDLLKSASSIEFINQNRDELESYVNAEFNPFHDVPNEMFSPFLHYSSIPPPPASFQADPTEHFFTIDDVDTQFDQFELSASLKKMNLKNTEESNSDIDSNSTASFNNKHEMNKLDEDFFDISRDKNDNASNFDIEYLKSIPTKPAKKLNELIMIKSSDHGKLIQSQEYSNDHNSMEPNLGTWNVTATGYSDNLNDIENEINSLKNIPKINKERF